MLVSFLITPRPTFPRTVAAILSNKIGSRRWFLCARAPAHHTVQCRRLIESTRLADGVGSGGHYETRFLRNHFGPGFADHARARRDGWVKKSDLEALLLQTSELAGGRRAESD